MENAIDIAVEIHRAADVDSITDSGYPVIPMSAEEWHMDCSDYLIGNTAELRRLLVNALEAPNPFLIDAQLGEYLRANFLACGLTVDNLREKA